MPAATRGGCCASAHRLRVLPGQVGHLTRTARPRTSKPAVGATRTGILGRPVRRTRIGQGRRCQHHDGQTHHSPYAAEVYLMAVKPSFHRAGIGTAMLRHLEGTLAARGVEFLQVKTLSAARPDLDYDKTRAFYLAYGFRPLEEFPTLWDPSNPALQLKAIPTQ
ncbi:MAG: GNAT family N-acetyltransferase [Acidimicrobiia bacterium]